MVLTKQVVRVALAINPPATVVQVALAPRQPQALQVLQGLPHLLPAASPTTVAVAVVRLRSPTQALSQVARVVQVVRAVTQVPLVKLV